MKHQYLGDINDYRKFCILRHLASQGRIRIGVCWMLTPDDQGQDGRKTSYLNRPEVWRDRDPDLFDILQRVVNESEGRLLSQIEGSDAIPGAVYFDEIVPDETKARSGYMRRALDSLAGVDLIFFDPDNGIEINSKPKGRKLSSKFLYWDEITNAFRPGRSVLIYQHYVRQNREKFTSRLVHELKVKTGALTVWAIHTPHVLFLLATSDAKIIRLAECLPTTFCKVGEHS